MSTQPDQATCKRYRLCELKRPSLTATLDVAAIIGREVTMSALREWAAALGGEAHQAVAVSSLGKWKTATQARANAASKTTCLDDNSIRRGAVQT